MELSSGRKVEKLNVLLTASPFTYQGHERVVLILEDLGDIAVLQRLLPASLNSNSLKNQPGRPTLLA